MGEYAYFNGRRVKIGTCENMYYLRADQAHLVEKDSHSLDPVADAAHIRFRFPFPDEDTILPGDFQNSDRYLALYGVEAPEGVEHTTVQFTSTRGYVTSLPCPEDPVTKGSDFGKRIHRNGFPGPVRIVQQRLLDGHLVTVCQCGGCGTTYRLPTLADAEPLIVALRSLADRETRRDDPLRAHFYHEIADRITRGYTEPAPF